MYVYIYIYIYIVYTYIHTHMHWLSYLGASGDRCGRPSAWLARTRALAPSRYIYIERERDVYVYTYIYIYIYMLTNIIINT